MLRSFVVWVWCLEKLLRLASLYPSFSPCSLECPSETQCLATASPYCPGWFKNVERPQRVLSQCSLSSLVDVIL